MIKRILSVALCLLLVSACFSACGSDGSDKQMVMPIDSEPEYLDPQIVSDSGARNIIANCFEGLVGFDENGKIVPAAAKEWKISSDGLEYTFTLREDLYWKVTKIAGKTTVGEDYEKTFDTKLTADDFVFGIRRALRSETKSPYAQNLMCIKNASKVNSGKLSEKKLGVKAVDERTVVITLERSEPDFLITLTTPACMPCNEKFFELTKGRYGLSTSYLIYNGPFYISNWADNTAITARRSDKYHAKLSDDGKTWVSSEPSKPSSIYYSFNNEKSTRARKVKDGTYDVALLNDTSELLQKKKVTVKQFDSAVFSLIFNCSDEILSNMKIRGAIAKTFDKNTVLKNAQKNAAAGIIPSAMIFADSSYRKEAAAFKSSKISNKKGAALLKSGLEELGLDSINITVLCDSEDENTVRAVMQKWQSVFGVIFGVSVEPVGSETLSERIASGDYQLALTNISFENSTALSCISRFTRDARDNFVGLNQKQYDSIVKEYVTAKSETAKRKAIEEAEAYLISCSVIVPIYETPVNCGIAKNVSGLVFSPSGEVVYFKNAVRP